MTKTGAHLTALYQRVYELAFNLPPGGLSKPDFSKADAGEDLINQLLGSGQSTAGPSAQPGAAEPASDEDIEKLLALERFRPRKD